MSEEPKAEKPKKTVSIIKIISQLSIVMDYDSHEAFGSTERSVLLAAPTSF